MRERRIALTGPQAAALHRLDGFREHDWPLRWVGPAGGRGSGDVIRTRHWTEPNMIGEVPVAPVALVLRHLGGLPAVSDGLSDRDRLELAVEHALRDELVGLDDLRVPFGRGSGDRLLQEILALRGTEPATESYAETRALQRFRSFGLTPWRQVPIVERGKTLHRVDFVIPFRARTRRPVLFLPGHGFVIEIDSRGFHDGRFYEDHERTLTYDALGYHWQAFTPNQIEHQPERVRRAILNGLTGRLVASIPG